MLLFYRGLNLNLKLLQLQPILSLCSVIPWRHQMFRVAEFPRLGQDQTPPLIDSFHHGLKSPPICQHFSITPSPPSASKRFRSTPATPFTFVIIIYLSLRLLRVNNYFSFASLIGFHSLHLIFLAENHSKFLSEPLYLSPFPTDNFFKKLHFCTSI